MQKKQKTLISAIAGRALAAAGSELCIKAAITAWFW